ncbi:delta-like protein 4 [Lytechinus variegatus]|uniref:delta-like protein 4 n=1 Tax=Lytechinus variegatus TaxID=7654 RepID=UPI001BB1A8E4|nr:delta-like protein 4 [Lytechinus variegatus]
MEGTNTVWKGIITVVGMIDIVAFQNDLYARNHKNLPAGATSVGVYKCSSTSTITGTSTSTDVTILSQDRHFQPSDGRLTKTVYPGDDITLSVSTTDSYASGTAEIRWSTFSNFAEGSLSPSGDGALTYTIRSASKSDADVYGTFQNNAVDNRLYSLIRVIVGDCPRGRWNLPLCNRLCDNCYNGGICHPQSGTCICPPGFRGKNCLTACGKHRFGWECEIDCGAGNVLDTCSGSQICLPDPYGCNCLSGYTGIYCDEQCTPGRFGVDCLQYCHCAGGMPCDAFTGECEGSCEDGWSGEGCQVTPICPVGYYGINCTEFCNCPDLSECEKDSGFCTSSEGQCEIGFVAESPEKPDRCATFAGCFESCSKTCHCAATVTCDDESGSCPSCHPRWSGDNCQTDRFTATREKTNPGTAIISCTFDADSDGSLSMRASIGDFSAESFVTATSTDTSDGSSLQSNFTLSIDDIETKTIYCFVGNSTSDDGFAYISLLPQGTFGRF